MLNTGYEVIVAGLLGAFTAQLVKFASYWIRFRVPNFRLMVETGGMPSSHSATMTALSCSVGLVSGFASVDFAIAMGVALIVMYDAAGVRRAAGKMAGVLNKVTEDIYSHHPDKVPDRLKELLGHTPFEVLVGAILGVLLAVVFHQGLETNPVLQHWF